MASASAAPSLLRVYLVTFNCARTLLDPDAFAASLFAPYSGAGIAELPDIVVFCLEEIAPIAYSFLGGGFLTSYFARFVQAVGLASGSTAHYKHVASHNAGMTGILVLAKPDITPQIRWLQTADVGVGKWAMGNKGAAAVRLGYAASDDDNEPTALTFVAAHLAAMEDEVKRRNLDWENIVRGLSFTPSRNASRARGIDGAHDSVEAEPLIAKDDPSRDALFSPGSPIFFAGDLNYRSSSKGPGPDDAAKFPQPTLNRNDPKHYSHLLKHEQLFREMKAGNTLHLLIESRVDFPPTYKFSAEQQTQAAKSIKLDQGEPTAWLWSSHRWPSWTDRILFSAHLAASDKALKIVKYGPLAIQPTSDHRPVAMAYQLDPALAESLCPDYDPPFPLNPQWAEHRAAARRLEVAVGILAYLGLTWEGNGLMLATLVGALGGWLVIQSFVSA